MRIVVVGGGFGGIATVIELLEHGFTDVTLIEAAPELRGTWFHNDYPGAACDVPSHLYSYSFAQRDVWSRFCSPQREILQYLQGVADRYGVTSRAVVDTRVTACGWDATTATWSVHTQDVSGRVGVERADAVVVATGQLHRPSLPTIAGRESFAGRAFHSARWEHDYDLRGKRVAVIGTGASAVQFVPEIAPLAERLVVFQRTGNWFLPRQNTPYRRVARTALRQVPGARSAWRRLLFRYTELLTLWIRHPRTVGHLGRLWSTVFMRLQLRDPDVRRKAWPDYRFGCKRVLFSSHFLPALQRPNVELVTERIAAMTPTGPRTADGVVHEVDCIVYGTGFRAGEFRAPMQITGVGGRVLEDVWRDGAHAHLGVSVPGFPSLFVVYGPNTNTSGGSIVHFLEAQAGYVRRALQLVEQQSAAALDIRPEVEERSDRAVQAGFAGTAWLECDSWYRDATGRIVTNWPGYMGEYADQAADVRVEDYEFVRTPS